MTNSTDFEQGILFKTVQYCVHPHDWEQLKVIAREVSVVDRPPDSRNTTFMIDCNGQRQRKRWIRVSIKSREKEKQIGVQCMKTNRVRYYCPLNERTPCKWTERAIMWTTENQTRWLTMHEDQFAGNHLSIVFFLGGILFGKKERRFLELIFWEATAANLWPTFT